MQVVALHCPTCKATDSMVRTLQDMLGPRRLIAMIACAMPLNCLRCLAKVVACLPTSVSGTGCVPPPVVTIHSCCNACNNPEHHSPPACPHFMFYDSWVPFQPFYVEWQLQIAQRVSGSRAQYGACTVNEKHPLRDIHLICSDPFHRPLL